VCNDQSRSDDLCFSEPFIEDLVGWLDAYVDDIACPSNNIGVRSRGRYGFSYKAEALIRCIILSSMITDNSSFELVLRHALQLSVPAAAIDQCLAALQHVPKKATLSKHALQLDAAFCLFWQQEWQAILRPVNKTRHPCVFFSADSSPQFGRDWFLQEATIVRDVEAAAALLDQLRKMLPRRAATEAEWNTWAASMPKHEQHTFAALSARLADAVQKHVLLPTCLASRHGAAANKMHNMLHAMHCDTGSWENVQHLCASIAGFVTDRGAERLLESTPFDVAGLASLDFLPCFDSVRPVAQPQPVPRPRPSNEPIALDGVEAAIVVIEVSDDPDLVPSSAGGMAECCKHSGCREELHACCPECLMQLCAGHLENSRCHEHGADTKICPCQEFRCMCSSRQFLPGQIVP
jgi:hypothetical protein